MVKTLKGSDISDNNGTIDWTKIVMSGLSFIYVKATEGATFHDPMFAHNYASVKSSGLLRGAYCFARPKTSTAIDEANSFVDIVNANGGFELPPVLDMEDNGGLSTEDLISYIRAWMAQVKSRTGRQGILYTYSSFITDNNLHGMTDIPLWIADYSPSQPIYTGDWGKWVFWQYTESGSVDGINGNVDLDYFNGTIEQLKELAGISSKPTFAQMKDGKSGYSGFVADVEWAYNNGILGHYPDDTIRPQDFITREQFAYAMHEFVKNVSTIKP